MLKRNKLLNKYRLRKEKLEKKDEEQEGVSQISDDEESNSFSNIEE